MVDRDLCHGIGFGEAKIDGNTATPLLIRSLTAPEGDAAANWTEVELYCPASDVALRRARYVDAFTFIIVGPQHAIATANCAVACGRTSGLPSELPAHRAAMAAAFDHPGVNSCYLFHRWGENTPNKKRLFNRYTATNLNSFGYFEFKPLQQPLQTATDWYVEIRFKREFHLTR